MDHYRNPRRKGILPEAHATSHEENPSCGDRVQLWIVVAQDRLIDASFQGEGCVISQAAASMLLHEVCGKLLSDIAVCDAEYMKNLIGIELGPVRLKCALLSLQALHTTIALCHQQG